MSLQCLQQELTSSLVVKQHCVILSSCERFFYKRCHVCPLINPEYSEFGLHTTQHSLSVHQHINMTICEQCKVSSVKGAVDGVPMSVLCSECTSISDDEESPLCTQTTAKSLGLKPADMTVLQYKSVRNPHYRGAAPMKLFLRAECQFLAAQRAAASADKQALKTAEQTEKRDSRKRRLPFDSDKIPSSVRTAWLGDYLSLQPKTTRRHVLAVHKVAKLALCAAASVRATAPPLRLAERLLNFAQQRDIKTPDGLGQAFLRTQDLFEQVIHLHYGRMVSFLCSEDRQVLLTSAPQFRAEHLELQYSSQSRLMSALRRQLSESEAQTLIALPAVRRRIGRYKTHQMDAEDVAAALVHFHHRGDSDRELELQQEMQHWGVAIRGDSSFCEQYISGGIDVDASEVAATMWLTSHLFDAGGHRLWSKYSGDVENRLCELVFRHGRSWHEAAHLALRALPSQYR